MATSFKDGLKYVNGAVHHPVIIHQVESSNGFTIYTAVRWDDGTASCNCPGWSHSKANPKTCKHAKAALVATEHTFLHGSATLGQTGQPSIEYGSLQVFAAAKPRGRALG